MLTRHSSEEMKAALCGGRTHVVDVLGHGERDGHEYDADEDQQQSHSDYDELDLSPALRRHVVMAMIPADTT